ncbi:SRPBCC family protein [Streptacidiphilus griseoplanus]|uniref:SRPBCC family protein n=1 Tax=Peterkaempfera griseoplana TaxID=66896 RepID=UPI0006E2B31F|nr:SRPBCC family protein [Peterkaempfera griseoplana]
MAPFRLQRRSPLSAGQAWQRVTDWQRQGRQVPLTRITVTPPPPSRVGTMVVARTALGRAGFDDPMEIVLWEPPDGGRPGRCRLEKRGRAVLGWAEIEVVPDGDGSVVRWCEDLRVRHLPGLLDGPTRWSGRLVFGRALRRLLADG